MSFNTENVRALLNRFEFTKLFVEELGWDRHNAELSVSIGEKSFLLKAVAEKRGMAVWACRSADPQRIPDRATRKLIQRQVAKTTLENVIIFTDGGHLEQVWSWSRREPGKPTSVPEHFWYASTANRGFIQKLEAIAFSFSEEANLTLVDVTGRARAAFDVERVAASTNAPNLSIQRYIVGMVRRPAAVDTGCRCVFRRVAMTRCLPAKDGRGSNNDEQDRRKHSHLLFPLLLRRSVKRTG